MARTDTLTNFLTDIVAPIKAKKGDDTLIPAANIDIEYEKLLSSEIKPQTNKDVTPSFIEQTITPDEGFDYLAQVTVAAISVTEIDNSAGGKTLTIGG